MATIEIKGPQKTPFSPAFNAQRWATFGAISTGILGAFVSNAAAPEQVDLSISGWVVGASQAPQGPVPPTIFASQTDPTQIQPNVWKSIVAGKTPRVPPLTLGGIQQADPTQIPARVWPSQFSPPVPAAQPLRSIFAAPESVDLSISSWVLGSALANQVSVPPFIFAQQSNPTQLAPSAWKSQPAPVVITPGPLASFVQAAPELVDLSISGWTIGTSQFSATTSGLLASFFTIGPQTEDRQTRLVWPSVIGYANPLAPEYRFGTHAKAIHEAEARKSSVWGSQPAGPLIGAVPAQVRGTPQADPSLNQTKVWTPSTFTTPTVGVTVTPIFVVQPQFDFTVNSTRIWGPGLTPLLPPLPLDVSPVLRNFSLTAWRRWHRPEDERRLRELQITPAVAEIIANVAERQAQTLETSERARIKEFTRELELRRVRFQARYLELLNAERQQLIDAEIKGFYEAKQALDEENKRRLLLLLAFLS